MGKCPLFLASCDLSLIFSAGIPVGLFSWSHGTSRRALWLSWSSTYFAFCWAMTLCSRFTWHHHVLYWAKNWAKTLFLKKVRERWDPKKVHDMLTHLHTSQPIWIRSAGLPLHLSKWVRGRDGKGLQASADYCTGMIRIIYPWASGMEHRFGAQISLKYVRC